MSLEQNENLEIPRIDASNLHTIRQGANLSSRANPQETREPTRANTWRFPAMVATTPAMERVRALADQAKDIPDGIYVHFRADAYGGLQQAAYAARTFQTAFSSLRAKTRRKSVVLSNEPFMTRDLDVKGPYDMLACAKQTMPDGEGYFILLCPAHAMNFATDVTLVKTGEQLPAFRPGVQRNANLIEFWVRKMKESRDTKRPVMRTPFSEEDEEFAFAHDEEGWNMFYEAAEVETPKERARAANVSLATLHDDFVNDVPDDVDIFSGEALDSEEGEAQGSLNTNEAEENTR